MHPQYLQPVLKTASELKQLKVSTAILLVVGSLSVGTGLWFVLDDFPFTGPDDYSAKFGMRKDQMPPTVVASSLHAWDQVGFLSISYGMFVIALAWFGVRRGNPIAWIGLLLGGTPAAIGGPIELRYNLETGDAGGGDVLVWLVLALFIAALAIPAKQMIAALKAMPPVQKV